MVFNSGKGGFVHDCALALFTFDVETIALHEFGHFGRLVHTADQFSVMYPTYQGADCTLSGHDVRSMNNTNDHSH